MEKYENFKIDICSNALDYKKKLMKMGFKPMRIQPLRPTAWNSIKRALSISAASVGIQLRMRRDGIIFGNMNHKWPEPQIERWAAARPKSRFPFPFVHDEWGGFDASLRRHTLMFGTNGSGKSMFLQTQFLSDFKGLLSKGIFGSKTETMKKRAYSLEDPPEYIVHRATQLPIARIPSPWTMSESTPADSLSGLKGWEASPDEGFDGAHPCVGLAFFKPFIEAESQGGAAIERAAEKLALALAGDRSQLDGADPIWLFELERSTWAALHFASVKAKAFQMLPAIAERRALAGAVSQASNSKAAKDAAPQAKRL